MLGCGAGLALGWVPSATRACSAISAPVPTPSAVSTCRLLRPVGALWLLGTPWALLLLGTPWALWLLGTPWALWLLGAPWALWPSGTPAALFTPEVLCL